MAKSINQVTLMGRLTRDPEVRTTPNGKNVASFSIAVDRQGSDDQADFIGITAWEKLSDLVAQYLHKGSRVLVQGRLRQDTWEDKDSGQKRSRIDVTAFDVTFLDPPSGRSAGGDRTTAPDSASQEEIIDDSTINLDEIPF
ncbi:single-stranded DNA-binding protein [Candidatus Saccharibacteria bacterium]|nr:single-stranded DNA-binding protein [Candidatus Saccharibacteria bacterium]MBP9986109.1 single-stranded DNA-binding protein [Candidatus Saccharibacteria bacterium]